MAKGPVVAKMRGLERPLTATRFFTSAMRALHRALTGPSRCGNEARLTIVLVRIHPTHLRLLAAVVRKRGRPRMARAELHSRPLSFAVLERRRRVRWFLAFVTAFGVAVVVTLLIPA